MSDRTIKILATATFIVAPFFLSYGGKLLGAEWIGRLVGLLIVFIGFPIFLIWLLLRSDDSAAFTYKKKRYKRPGRIIGFILAIILLTYSYQVALDIGSVLNGNIPSVRAKVIKTKHNPYTFVVRGQFITLQGLDHRVTSIFSPYLARTGDYVEVKYLPRTHLVLEIRPVEPSMDRDRLLEINVLN